MDSYSSEPTVLKLNSPPTAELLAKTLGYHRHVMTEPDDSESSSLLDYVIAHGRLREHAARRLAQQIASALAFCHHRRIVHRDIKLENIILSRTGDARITNFGLSAVFDPQGHLSTYCGTSYFPAPEMISQKPYVGPEIDVWGFGAVLYILVCGRVPFDAREMDTLHAKIKSGLVEYPFHLSPECKNLLGRMLTVDPASRALLSEVVSHPWMTNNDTRSLSLLKRVKKIPHELLQLSH
ncbi:kinase-like domain-containing protein [Mycena metata]|uniref:Kinase-like domain-containing protein n=1 Tax=Mycena metata TaxID=1033252 RepID=A0AAD7JTQ4_9AGAR|nr:kinase-like domain-containing protein [Mycena metata]